MQQVSPKELKTRRDAGEDLLLVDVREDWEHAAFNIGGLHIPMGHIMQHLAAIPTEHPVVVYCEKGIRSTIVIQRLEQAGYTNLLNLAGGMKAWKQQL